MVTGLKSRISCVAIRDDLLIMGLVNYEILEISISQDKILSKSKLEEPITSVSISDDQSIFAASSTDGSIMVKSTNNGWGKKTITSNSKEEYFDKLIFVNSREFFAMGCGKIIRFKMVKVSLILEW